MTMIEDDGRRGPSSRSALHGAAAVAAAVVATFVAMGTASAGNKRIFLKTQNGKFIGAETNGSVQATRSPAGPNESFVIIDKNGGALENGNVVFLKTQRSTFLTAEGGGGRELKSDRTVVKAWETFQIIKVGGSSGSSIVDGDKVGLKTHDGKYFV